MKFLPSPRRRRNQRRVTKRSEVRQSVDRVTTVHTIIGGTALYTVSLSLVTRVKCLHFCPRGPICWSGSGGSTLPSLWSSVCPLVLWARQESFDRQIISPLPCVYNPGLFFYIYCPTSGSSTPLFTGPVPDLVVPWISLTSS